jgi:hypothetical protein
MSRSQRPVWIAVLLLTACAALFWIERVHVERPGAHGLVSSDMDRYFYPAAVYLHRELRAGRLPLWNPYQLAGLPFLAAHQPAVLYPPRAALLLLLRPARALEVEAVLHLAIAGVFTWLFAARLGLCAAARASAALAFMFSSELQLRLYNPAFLATAVWLPALLWGVHRLLCAPRAANALVLGLLLALACLAGLAQTFLFEVQLAGAYGLFGLFAVAQPGRRARAAGLALAAGALALALSAAQLLPAFELARLANRGLEPLSLAQAAEGQLGVGDLLRGLLGALAPLFFGEAGGAPWGRLVAACLPLWACGFLDRERRAHWLFLGAAALFGGLFLLGSASPVFRLYHALPLGDVFRFPFRLSFLYVFCLCLLLGIGVEGARRALRGRGRAALAVPLGLAAWVVGESLLHNEVRYALPILWGEQAYAPPALIELLRARGLEGRVFVDGSLRRSPVLDPALGMLNGVYAVPAYEALLPAEYARSFARRRFWKGFQELDDDSRLARPQLLALLDALSVRFYASSLRPARALPGQPIPGRFGAVALSERAAALPRAYLVHEVLVEPDPERAARRLLREDFDPRALAVVERALPGLGRPGQGDAASLRAVEPARVSADVACAESCLLVTTELFYPGWRAHVDGAPAEILRVNGLLRGVVVGPGEHVVHFEYRPASFRGGAAISLAALFAVALGALAAASRYRRGSPGVEMGKA